MPECLLFAYADNMPRIRAERLRDAAQSALYPHLTKQGAKDWLRSINSMAQRVVSTATQGITFNGRPVTLKGLRRRLSQAMGGGFSDD